MTSRAGIPLEIVAAWQAHGPFWLPNNVKLAKQNRPSL